MWISDYGYDETLHAFDKSAGKLGVEQLDLLHPAPGAARRFDRTLAAYRALEKLLADGRVRAIGVSNFMPEHLDRAARRDRRSCRPSIRSRCTRTSSRPTLQAPTPRTASLTQAWSPIGGITSYRGAGAKSTFDDPRILEIAAGTARRRRR